MNASATQSLPLLIRTPDSRDDAALRTLMSAQMNIDPLWPPEYAHNLDIARWLEGPADVQRWVAVDSSHGILAHAGLGQVKADVLGQALKRASGLPTQRLWEICRLVVHPDHRKSDLGSVLTRRAMRYCIERGQVPIAKVLSNRGTWLQMMCDTGWRVVGQTVGSDEGTDYFALLPAQRFIEAAQDNLTHA